LTKITGRAGGRRERAGAPDQGRAINSINREALRGAWPNAPLSK
jgi:hypothetical protein